MTMRSRSSGSPDATRAVDWEQRIDFPKLRSDRLARAKAALDASDLGGLLLFDPNNIRYVTSTHIGEWARDKNARYTLLPRGDDPILWDFGSAARHHQLFAPWLPPENFRAGVAPMRGAMPVETGIPDRLGERIALELRERGLAGEPLGVDMADLVTIEALQRAGVHVTDGSRVMLEARKIKTAEEIALLDQSAGLVDAVYEEIYRMLRPGIYEHEIVGRAHQLLFEMGSEHVEAINAVSGDRCIPHPHVFSDRLLRPGDQAFFDIIHSFMGYRTCYYRTFNVGGVSPAQVDAYKRCREWLDAAIALVGPGMTTDRIAEVWPTAKELGFADEETCFGLQFGHGIGVGLYEPPMISRVHSLDHPVEIEEGMVFALETYCAATDGRSAARIEEEVVVTATGCEVITRFPADELLVAGKTYVRGADLLPDGAAGGDGVAGGGGRVDIWWEPAPAMTSDTGTRYLADGLPSYRLVRREDVQLADALPGRSSNLESCRLVGGSLGFDAYGADAGLPPGRSRRRARPLVRDRLLRARGRARPLSRRPRSPARARRLRGRAGRRPTRVPIRRPQPRGSRWRHRGPAWTGATRSSSARRPTRRPSASTSATRATATCSSSATGRWTSTSSSAAPPSAHPPSHRAWRRPFSPTAASR